MAVPALLSGVGVAVQATVVGLVSLVLVVLVGWTLTPHEDGSGLGVPVRVAALAWLSAHLVPIVTLAGPFSLMPLLLCLLPVLLLRRGLTRSVRALEPATLGQALLPVVSAAAVHAGLTSALAWMSASESAAARPGRAALHALVLVVVVGIPTAVAASGLADDVLDRIPRAVRAGVRGGVAAGLVVVIVASIAVAAAAVQRRSDVAAVAEQVGGRGAGLWLVLLLSVLYVPTIVGWAAAALTGAGVHVGGDAVLTLHSAAPGALPPVPVLALLPDALPPWTPWLRALVVAAGLIGGVVAGRRIRTAPTGAQVLAWLLVTATAAGSIAALAAMTTGSWGAQRLADLGPHVRDSLVLSAASVAGGAALVLVAPRIVTALRRSDRPAPGDGLGG